MVRCLPQAAGPPQVAVVQGWLLAVAAELAGLAAEPAGLEPAAALTRRRCARGRWTGSRKCWLPRTRSGRPFSRRSRNS